MPFECQPCLTSALLEVSPLAAEDYDELYAVAQDPLLWEQHPDKEMWRPEGFRRFFNEALASGGALKVVDAGDLRVIGSSRYYGHDEQRSEIEIGWTFLARSHWGGLYNAELKGLMLTHAFIYVSTVVFLVAPGNLRSQRAVEKIGAVPSGFRRDRQRLVYRLNARDWTEAAAK